MWKVWIMGTAIEKMIDTWDGVRSFLQENRNREGLLVLVTNVKTNDVQLFFGSRVSTMEGNSRNV